MVDFDVILGMDGLTPYHAIVDYFSKTVTLASLSVPKIAWKGALHSDPKRIVSYV